MLGTNEPSHVVLGQEGIGLRTSRVMGCRVQPAETLGKPVGTPDGVQMILIPESFVDPLRCVPSTES